MIVKLLLLGVLASVLGRPQDNQVIDTRCDPGRDYLIPHRYDITKYYYCQRGYRDEEPMRCPHGMKFSFEAQTCHTESLQNDSSEIDENAIINSILGDDGIDVIGIWGDEGSGEGSGEGSDEGSGGGSGEGSGDGEGGGGGGWPWPRNERAIDKLDDLSFLLPMFNDDNDPALPLMLTNV